VHFYNPIVNIRPFRTVVLLDFIDNILFVITDSLNKVQTSEWSICSNCFFIFFNLVALFIDRFLSICSQITLPFAVDDTICWCLKQTSSSCFCLLTIFSQFNNVGKLLITHNIEVLETNHPRLWTIILKSVIEINNETTSLSFR